MVIAALLLFISAVLAVNTWFLTRLTNDVSAQIGRSAFAITKDTVETMLSYPVQNELLFVERTLANDDKSQSSERRVSTLLPNPAIENTIDLKLDNQKDSQSLILVRGQQEYPINIPRSEIEDSLQQVKRNIWLSGSVLVISSLIFTFFFLSRLTSPLRAISKASEDIGAGNFGIHIPVEPKPIGKEINQLVAAINTMSDKLAEGEKLKAQIKEQQTTEEISELVRGMAHSIRNPLHTIALSLDLDTAGLEAKEQQSELIRKQIERIDNHIKSLMIITSHSSLQPEPLNLNELLLHITTQQSVANEGNKIVIDGEYSKLCYAVQNELITVFEILISNAIEASPVQSEILIQCENSADHFSFAVIDKGCGLQLEQLENLFSPHNTSKTYGSGMGLYIANKMIRGRYQGTIDYSHTKHIGTQFKVTFKDRVTA